MNSINHRNKKNIFQSSLNSVQIRMIQKQTVHAKTSRRGPKISTYSYTSCNVYT